MNERLNQVNAKVKQVLEEGKAAVSSLTEIKKKAPKDITIGGLSPGQKNTDEVTQKELEINACAPLRLFCPNCQKTFEIPSVSSGKARCFRCLKRYQIPMDGVIRIFRWEGKGKSTHSRDGIFATGKTKTRFFAPEPAEITVNGLLMGSLSLFQKVISIPVAYGSYKIRAIGIGKQDVITVKITPGKYIQSVSLAEAITIKTIHNKMLIPITDRDKTKELVLKKM